MSLSKNIFKRLILVIFFLVLPFFLLNSSVKAQEYNSREIIVKIRPLSSSDRLKFHRDLNTSVTSEIPNLGVLILDARGMEIPRMIERFKLDPRVEYAEPDFKAYAYETTNDPALLQNLQWGLLKIKAADTTASAWNISHGLSSVKVAVLDTGISQNHPDLQGKILGNKNCTNSSTVDDLFGHGTHVAGIIAANTNNGIGVAGVGYDISLINAKGLGDDGSGYYSWLANCIVWAVDNGVKVINMSLGGSSDSQLLKDAVAYAWGKGVVLVAAAGNSNSKTPSYPAYYTKVLSVAATDQNDKRASFSNYGSWVDVAAPGVSIYSTLPTFTNSMKQLNYGSLSGTSMASPFVAGLAGLLFSVNNPDNTRVVSLIEENADRISGTGSNWIYGRINAYKSMQSISNTLVLSPTPTPTPKPTYTPTPTSTPTPEPTIIPTIFPSPTNIPSSSPGIVNPAPKTPLSKLCLRFPSFCR